MYKIQKNTEVYRGTVERKNLIHLHTYSDHCVRYTAVQSVCCTLETNVTTCINSTSIKKKSYINLEISNKTINLCLPGWSFQGRTRHLDEPIQPFQACKYTRG